ncbi:hypothetical protein WG915_04490 [Corynebacterium sp. H128]|uniref:hypothetical protein n=1 Tax=Corynebacterium sp. H128 TaxID=3133427 RepID=UPI0030AF1C23
MTAKRSTALLVAGFTAGAIACTNPAFADTEAPGAESISPGLCAHARHAGGPANLTSEPVSEEEKQQWLDRIDQDAKLDGLVIHSGLDSLKYEDATVNKTKTDAGEFTVVLIPIGGEYSETSSFAAMFDNSGETLAYTEALYPLGDGEPVQMERYVNGKRADGSQTDLHCLSESAAVPEGGTGVSLP